MELIIFTTIILISNFSCKTCQKSTKKTTKGLTFTTLDTSQSKKLMIMKVFTAKIHFIWVLIMQVDILKKKNGNKYFIFDSTDEKKEALKKYTDVWMELKIKSKQ